MTVGPLMVKVWQGATLQPGLSKRALSMWCAETEDWRFVRRAIDRAISAGLLSVEDGPNHARLVYATAIANLTLDCVRQLAAYYTRTSGAVPPAIIKRLKELVHDELAAHRESRRGPVAGRARDLPPPTATVHPITAARARRGAQPATAGR